MSRPKTTRRAGFTLLEVLLAAALATSTLVVLVEVAQRAFVGAHSSQFAAHAQRTALTAERLLRVEAAPGGDAPCPDGVRRITAAARTAGDYWLDAWAAGAMAFAHDSAEAQAVAHTGEADRPRVADSDVLVLRRFGPPTEVQRHHLDAQRFALKASGGFEAGDFAVVCDASTAVLFQITRVSPRGRSIAYSRKQAVHPGNRVGEIRAHRDCGESACPLEGALVSRYRVSAFYLGRREKDAAASLYRKTLTKRRYDKGEVRALMLSGEILGGLRSLRAVVVMRDARLFTHAVGAAAPGRAVGVAVTLSTAAAAQNPDEAVTHTVNAAL